MEPWHEYLHVNEKLLWEGKPIAGIGDWRIYDWQDRILSAVFGAIGLLLGTQGFREAVTQLSEGSVGLGLLILFVVTPFIPAGIYLVFLQWPAIALAYRYRRYALTDRAAYIMDRWPTVRVKVIPLSPTTAVELVKGRRSSSVWAFVVKTSDGDGGFKVEKEGFENITDGEAVFCLIRSIQMGTQ